MILDTESETFEQDSIEFIEEYFDRNCANFESLECGELADMNDPTTWVGEKYMKVSYNWDENAKRSVSIECINVKEWDYTTYQCQSNSDCADRTDWAFTCVNGVCARESSGIIPWQMKFLVESPTEIPVTYESFKGMNYYYNEDDGTRCMSQEACDYYIQNK